MVECLVYIGEPWPSVPPLSLTFAAVPRPGERVWFKARHATEADAYEVKRVSYLAEDGAIGPEIHLVVAPLARSTKKAPGR